MDFVADTLLDGRQFGAHSRGSLELAQSNNRADFTLTGKKVVAAALASGKAVWLPEDHHRGQWERIYLEGAGCLGLCPRGEAGCDPTWKTRGASGD